MTKSKSFILLTLAGLALIALGLRLDSLSQSYLNRALNRSIVTFLSARGLNAAISVAQGTEFSVQPLGLGVTLTPGQILDPVDDLVEQLSSVLLVSTISLGTQQILLKIVTSTYFTFLIFVIVFFTLLSAIRGYSYWKVCRAILLKACCLLLFLRFCIPLLALASDGVYRMFLSVKYEEAASGLSTATTQVEQASSTDITTSNQPSSVVEQVGNMLGQIASPLESLNAKVAKYKAIATSMVEFLINLVIVFVTETIFIPLVSIWILKISLTTLLRRSF